ncbi:MAG: hypothetical protein O9308_07410 [Beijerinckiaceae bacterium]|nr:hypothetical protein [Beijerinckiaceae bacterium]
MGDIAGAQGWMESREQARTPGNREPAAAGGRRGHPGSGVIAPGRGYRPN